jgi:hypothetical protein
MSRGDGSPPLMFQRWVRLSIVLLAQCAPTLGMASDDTVSVAGPPEAVWRHDSGACDNADYSDVPVRPLINDRGEILWFAGNSHGYRPTRGGSGGADRLATMERVDCSAQLGELSQGTVNEPQAYHANLWLEAPFTLDGRNVYALAHDEFHGEWTGDPRYCDEQALQHRIVLRCNYWNVIAARSSDGGTHFALDGVRSDGSVRPAIALPDPYVLEAMPAGNSASLEQGMAAQSNIIHWGQYFYVLVLQVVHGSPAHNPLDGVCIFRTADLGGPSTWRGWSAATRTYSIAVPQSYPMRMAQPQEHCSPVLPTHYRFTWSYNVPLRRFIIIGLDASFQHTDQAAFVYMTASLDPLTGELQPQSREGLLMHIAWLPQWQRDPTIEGAAYPSLLDPSSPELSDSESTPVGRADRNFQLSGARPYLYFTRLNPRTSRGGGANRDVVRVPLRVTAGAPNG